MTLKRPNSQGRKPTTPRRRASNTALLRHRQGGSRKDRKRREALRAAFVYQEQRNPTNREQLVFPPKSPRLGSLSRPLLRHLVENTSRSAFQLEQQLWTYLAGNHTRYWRLDGSQKHEQPGEPLYAPLDENKKEIRVLKVSRVSNTPSGNDDDDGSNCKSAFKASLIRVSLDDDPAYIAISYKWGDPSTVGEFESHQKGGAKVEYNQTVFEVVSTLLPEASELYLWIDSICINQRDDLEKARQVAFMGEVYRRARQVVVFLGEPDEDTAASMDLYHRVGATGPLKQEPFDYTIEEFVKFKENSIKAGIYPRAWFNMGVLPSKRWFTRYWVVQEVALAIRPVLICGHHAVTWSHFIYVFRLVLSHLEPIRWLVESTFGERIFHVPWLIPPRLDITMASDIREEASKRSGLRLSWLIRLADIGGFQATDPRDRIFAVMGLAPQSDRKEEDLRPNYRIGVEDLYTQVARRLLTRMEGQEDRLYFLYRAGVGYPRPLQLPSWVPDWTSSRDGLLPHLFEPAKKPFPDPADCEELRVTFAPGFPQVAILQGYIIDRVASLSPISHPPNISIDLHQSSQSSMTDRERKWFDSVLGLIIATNHTAQTATSDAHATGLTTYDTLISSPRWKFCLWKTLIASSSSIVVSERDVVSKSILDRYLCFRGYWYARSDVEDDNYLGDSPILLKSNWEVSKMIKYHHAYSNATSQRRFFVSSKGYFGLTSPETQEGDLVCVFSGMITPIIVRPVVFQGLDSCHILVGEAYHYGIMEGELVVEPDLMGPIRLV